MLNASGPQAGQHGDSRAVEKCLGVDSVLRADPQAPRAHVDMLAAVRSGSQEWPLVRSPNVQSRHRGCSHRCGALSAPEWGHPRPRPRDKPVSRDPLTTMDVVFLALEYLNMFLLLSPPGRREDRVGSDGQNVPGMGRTDVLRAGKSYYEPPCAGRRESSRTPSPYVVICQRDHENCADRSPNGFGSIEIQRLSLCHLQPRRSWLLRSVPPLLSRHREM